MEDLNKEEILSEYFLVETEKTDEMKGWKVVGTIEGCAGQSVSPLLELKTDGDGWLCDFKIKLLHCGLVLASPEYVIDEDELGDGGYGESLECMGSSSTVTGSS